MNISEVLLLLTGISVLALILGLSWEHWSQQKHARNVMSKAVLEALNQSTEVTRLCRQLIEKLEKK